MKHRIISLLILMSFAAASCNVRKGHVEIIPIQDNPTERFMSRSLFPEAPDSLFEALGLEGGIPSSVCAFLVKSNGKNILFDAANGAPDSRLMPVLDSCGISPENIEMIFITHLHGDHIGGLMQNGMATFPNAKLYVNKVEYDAWMAMPQEQTERLRTTFEAYGSRLVTFDITDELPCGIEAIEAYGHTPGHTIYKAGDVLIVGDIMHGTALQNGNPQYCARFDMDKEQSIESRKRIMEMGKKENMKMYGMHFPSPYFL